MCPRYLDLHFHLQLCFPAEFREEMRMDRQKKSQDRGCEILLKVLVITIKILDEVEGLLGDIKGNLN